jgi:hypothetical protein
MDNQQPTSGDSFVLSAALELAGETRRRVGTRLGPITLLARALGVAPSTVRAWAAGIRPPPALARREIERLLAAARQEREERGGHYKKVLTELSEKYE